MQRRGDQEVETASETGDRRRQVVPVRAESLEGERGESSAVLGGASDDRQTGR